MTNSLKKQEIATSSKFDSNELELPDTVFIRDIENRVFQAIILHALAKITGISLIEGNFIDHIFGRDSVEGVKGINAEQDQHNHSVNIRVEISICYGVSIPEKAEEIQVRVSEEVTQMTGLHVGCVHVIFKNVILADPSQKLIQQGPSPELPEVLAEDETPIQEEYSEEL